MRLRITDIYDVIVNTSPIYTYKSINSIFEPLGVINKTSRHLSITNRFYRLVINRAYFNSDLWLYQCHKHLNGPSALSIYVHICTV